MFWKTWVALLLVTIGVAAANDVCYSPFSAFLKCMADDADKKLERYLQELSPSAKQQVQQCFSKSNCETPDFSKASVDSFLSPPWNERAKAILDLMENMDPKVKDCMIDFFKGLIKDAIDQCVHKNGGDELKDFEMPPLPDIRNTDVSKFKELVLDRMLVRTKIIKCGEDHGEATANKTIDCIADARKQHDHTLCTTREQCRESKLTDTKCRTRFDKVHEAACKCVQNHQAKMNLTRLIMGGGLEAKFKKCHEDNGVPYPEEKVQKTKDAINSIVADMLSNKKIPDQVKKTLKVARDSMKDIEEQWKGAFCSKCNKDGDEGGLVDPEISDLRKSIAADKSDKNQ